MRKKSFFILLFVFTLSLAFSVNEITDWDKVTTTADKVLYKDGKLFLDGKAVDIDEVSLIKFNVNKKKEDNGFVDNLSVEELMKRADILTKKYPDYGYYVLLDEGEQRMNKDKSQYSFSRYAMKICNESQLSNAQLSFYVRPNEYEVKLIMARSISLDGIVTYLDPADISYTSPNQGLQFFSGRTDTYIMKATIPNVEVGSIIDYVFETVEPHPEDDNQFTTGWFFGSEMPVYESIVTLTVPENVNYYWAISNFGNFDQTPKTTVHDGYKSYTFRRGECEPFIAEPNAPPKNGLIPQITGSTFKDQSYLSNWLSGFFKDRMVINDAMKALIDKTLQDAKASTEEEKIAVLYRFVQDYIVYRSIKTSISSGMAGHKATETFDNKYGDCIDKSIFFTTILNYVGVEAYPVIVMTNDFPQPPFGRIGVSSGNHAINEIHLQSGKIIYLDSTSTTDKYPYFRTDDHGINAWNPILNTIRMIEPPEPEQNTQEFIMKIDVAADKSATIFNKNIYRGEWESAWRYYFGVMNNSDIRALFTSRVSKTYPASLLVDYHYSDHRDFNSDFSIDYKYSTKNVLKNSGRFMIFQLPIETNYGETTLQTRKYPVKFDTTFAENRSITLNLPKDYEISGVPDSLNISNKFFDYNGTFNYEYSESANVLTFNSQYKRKVISVEPKDYTLYRDEILQIDSFIKAPILFTKVAK